MLKKEKGLSKAFGFLAFYYLIFMVLTAVVFFLWQRDKYSFEFDLTTGSWIAILVLVYVLGLLFSFVSAFFLKLWLRVFGGKGKFSDVYKLSIYSSLPTYLFGWIPTIGWISSIYSLVLLIKGTRIFFKFSTLKSTLIYVVPIIVLWVTIFIFAFIITFVALSAGAPSSDVIF